MIAGFNPFKSSCAVMNMMKTGETAAINLNLLNPRHYSKAIYNLNYLFKQTMKRQDFNEIYCLFVKKNTSNTFLSAFCFTFRRFRTVPWDHCMVHRPRSIILPTVGGHNHYHCLVLKVSTAYTSTVNFRIKYIHLHFIDQLFF